MTADEASAFIAQLFADMLDAHRQNRPLAPECSCQAVIHETHPGKLSLIVGDLVGEWSTAGDLCGPCARLHP